MALLRWRESDKLAVEARFQIATASVWVPRTVSPPLISESLPADLAVPAGAGRARSLTYGPGRQ